MHTFAYVIENVKEKRYVGNTYWKGPKITVAFCTDSCTDDKICVSFNQCSLKFRVFSGEIILHLVKHI